jgi:HD-GYP domain-containing protein (c-di-GMP phosphodiesterase class II)
MLEAGQDRSVGDRLPSLHGGKGPGPEVAERWTAEVVDSLVMLLAGKDPSAGNHISNVARMGRRIAQSLDCTQRQVRKVYLAAKLHDVGKCTIPASILQKSGPLTAEESGLMREHPVTGAEMVSRIDQLAFLAPTIRSHHEHYDGGGYPDGLRGGEIPLAARIVCVADAFDAMTSDRCYRRRVALEEAREELRRCTGSQFDPIVVGALERLFLPPIGEEEARPPVMTTAVRAVAARG